MLIRVIDNGAGIRTSDLDNVFKMDQKFLMPGTANENGTGLGFILCEEFVEKQNSKIWIESELGNGSLFFFYFALGLKG